jgi:hypothetical protein
MARSWAKALAVVDNIVAFQQHAGFVRSYLSEYGKSYCAATLMAHFRHQAVSVDEVLYRYRRINGWQVGTSSDNCAGNRYSAPYHVTVIGALVRISCRLPESGAL